MNLLYDTNILVFISKDLYSQRVKELINPDNKKVYVSIATIAELKSIALQNNWGVEKQQTIDKLLEKIIVVEVNENLANIYAEIDAYSQRRNPRIIDYPFATPRNIGKNDLWIASTAVLLGLTLVTTDADFNHLEEEFIEVQYIKPELFKVNNSG